MENWITSLEGIQYLITNPLLILFPVWMEQSVWWNFREIIYWQIDEKHARIWDWYKFSTILIFNCIRFNFNNNKIGILLLFYPLGSHKLDVIMYHDLLRLPKKTYVKFKTFPHKNLIAHSVLEHLRISFIKSKTFQLVQVKKSRWNENCFGNISEIKWLINKKKNSFLRRN